MQASSLPRQAPSLLATGLFSGVSLGLRAMVFIRFSLKANVHGHPTSEGILSIFYDPDLNRYKAALGCPQEHAGTPRAQRGEDANILWFSMDPCGATAFAHCLSQCTPLALQEASVMIPPVL